MLQLRSAFVMSPLSYSKISHGLTCKKHVVPSHPLLFSPKLDLGVPHRRFYQRKTGSPDERLIVGFAPKNYLLSSEYGDRAVSFFLQCKNDRELSASDIAHFVILADDDDSRRAALNYLAKGDHARGHRDTFA
jgi:hypothetical protein